MIAGIWDVLGIAPTSDHSAIRRAYAAKLKQARPEDDPDAFIRLRSAYEAALTQATRPQAAQAPVHAANNPVPPPPEAEAFPGSEPTLETQIASCISTGDVNQAARLLANAQSSTTLPISPWLRLTESLAWRLALDPEIDDRDVEIIAQQFGWTRGSDLGATQAIQGLHLRIQARRWLAGVTAEAGKKTRFLGNERAASCALLVGKRPLPISWLLPPYHHIRQLLSEMQAHGEWAERKLDAQRIKRLRACANDARGRQIRRYCSSIIVGAALALVGQFPLAVVAPFLIILMPLRWQRQLVAAGLILAALTAVLGVSRTTSLQFGVAAVTLGFFVIAVLPIILHFRRGPHRILRALRACAIGLVAAGAARALVMTVSSQADLADGIGIFCFCFYFSLIRDHSPLFKLLNRRKSPSHKEILQAGRRPSARGK